MIPLSVTRWRDIVSSLNPHTYGIEEDLLVAMVWQESTGDPAAIRFEIAWRYFWHPKPDQGLYRADWSVEQNRSNAWNILGSTEFYSQSFSWGLLQVMGSVARELGLKGYLAKLVDPEIGLKMGLLHFQKKLKQAKGDLKKALLFYNGGGNEGYATEVLAKHEEIKG